MLRIDEQQLISALLDGELTRDEKVEAVSLVNSNREARRYYKALKAQKAQLQSIVRLKSPIRVVEVLDKKLSTSGRNGFFRQYRWGIALAAVAASLLGGFYLLNNYLERSIQGGGIANDALATKQNGTDFERMLEEERTRQLAERNKVSIPKLNPDHFKKTIAALRFWGEQSLASLGDGSQSALLWLADAHLAYEGSLTESAILTSPITQLQNFKTLDLKLNYLKSTREFELQGFLDQFKDKGVFGIDCKSTDPNIALQRLVLATQQSGIPVFTDEEVKQRMNKKLAAPYIHYIENIEPKQLSDVMSKLQESDKWKLDASKETKFSSILINPLQSEGQKSLSQVLGLGHNKSKISATKPIGITVVYHAKMPIHNLNKELIEALKTLHGPKTDAISVAFIVR